jgi:acyl-CoA thioesterase FadM
VDYEISKRANGKIAASGYCVYTLVNIENGRAQNIPEDIAAKYSI